MAAAWQLVARALGEQLQAEMTCEGHCARRRESVEVPSANHALTWSPLRTAKSARLASSRRSEVARHSGFACRELFTVY